jgi:hypothetical protein
MASLENLAGDPANMQIVGDPTMKVMVEKELSRSSRDHRCDRMFSLTEFCLIYWF